MRNLSSQQTLIDKIVAEDSGANKKKNNKKGKSANKTPVKKIDLFNLKFPDISLMKF
jgi:hypothetical protein